MDAVLLCKQPIQSIWIQGPTAKCGKALYIKMRYNKCKILRFFPLKLLFTLLFSAISQLSLFSSFLILVFHLFYFSLSSIPFSLLPFLHPSPLPLSFYAILLLSSPCFSSLLPLIHSFSSSPCTCPLFCLFSLSAHPYCTAFFSSITPPPLRQRHIMHSAI